MDTTMQEITDYTRKVIREAEEIEMGAPSATAARRLGELYDEMESARRAGIDVDALIAEVRGF